MSFRGGAHTTQAREEALLEAEGTLVRPADGRTQVVKLKPKQVIIRAELFQPREFDFGGRETDRRHVDRLARRIKNVGELDPIVVVKLGKKWVCVDGHHRVTAYKKSQRTEEIKCEWFAGSVREAMDEGMRRNAALNLEVPLADRQEEAWKRVLLGGWTKKQIVETCSIAEGTVSLSQPDSPKGQTDASQGDSVSVSGGFIVTKLGVLYNRPLHSYLLDPQEC
jgi:hypothetical protein